MAKYASKVIEQAKAWLGFSEASGKHKQIIDVYNAHKPLARGYTVKYTDSWCATFVSAVSIKLGYTDIIPTECGCGEMVKLFQKLGTWVENENRTPNPGEIIFYDWQDDAKGDNVGWPDHVGIVEKVSNGVITVIEGNYKDSVTRRTIAVNGKNIRGYGVPKYDKEPVAAETYTHKQFVKDVQKACGAAVDGIAGPETLSKTVTVSAKFNNKHGVVKAMQKWLNALGYAEVGKADGEAGPKFTSALAHFQMDNDCTATGIAEEWGKTWQKLLKLV